MRRRDEEADVRPRDSIQGEWLLQDRLREQAGAEIRNVVRREVGEQERNKERDENRDEERDEVRNEVRAEDGAGLRGSAVAREHVSVLLRNRGNRVTA